MAIPSHSTPPNRSMTRNRTTSAVSGPTPAPVTAASLPHADPVLDTASEDTQGNQLQSTVDTTMAATTTEAKPDLPPTIRFMPHVDPRGNRPSLNFVTVSRTMKKPEDIVRVGRYSERDNLNNLAHHSIIPIGFKSKVVSRRHCELWCKDGQWYVKDVGSSSGTFLNNLRLSTPGVVSKPFAVRDGDLIQLGIDFKGGEEVIFRCVKMRVECNREWQKVANPYNTARLNDLLKSTKAKTGNSRVSDASAVGSSECSICLGAIEPYQAIFIAPCSHNWHFFCVSDLLLGRNYPRFNCPNCRMWADLSDEIDQGDGQATQPTQRQVGARTSTQEESPPRFVHNNPNTSPPHTVPDTLIHHADDGHHEDDEDERRPEQGNGADMANGFNRARLPDVNALIARELEDLNPAIRRNHPAQILNRSGLEPEVNNTHGLHVSHIPGGWQNWNVVDPHLNPPNPFAHYYARVTRPPQVFQEPGRPPRAPAPTTMRLVFANSGSTAHSNELANHNSSFDPRTIPGSPGTPTNNATFALSVMTGQGGVELEERQDSGPRSGDEGR